MTTGEIVLRTASFVFGLVWIWVLIETVIARRRLNREAREIRERQARRLFAVDERKPRERRP